MTPQDFQTTAVAWITAVEAIIVASVVAITQIWLAIQKAKIAQRVSDLERSRNNHGQAIAQLQLGAAPPAPTVVITDQHSIDPLAGNQVP